MKRIILYFLFAIGFTATHAMPAYECASPPMLEMQSVRTMQCYSRYQSTSYRPFSSATPSEIYAEANSSSSSPKHRPGNPKTFAGGPDQTGPSPVGEPWILALFAILFAGLIALKKKKKLEI